MWNTLMAVNSFAVWPATFIFFLYSIGRLILYFDWKLLVVAFILFILSTIAQITLALLEG